MPSLEYEVLNLTMTSAQDFTYLNGQTPAISDTLFPSSKEWVNEFCSADKF